MEMEQVLFQQWHISRAVVLSSRSKCRLHFKLKEIITTLIVQISDEPKIFPRLKKKYNKTATYFLCF